MPWVQSTGSTNVRPTCCARTNSCPQSKHIGIGLASRGFLRGAALPCTTSSQGRASSRRPRTAGLGTQPLVLLKQEQETVGEKRTSPQTSSKPQKHPPSDPEPDVQEEGFSGKVIAAGAVVGGLVAVGGLAYEYQDQIRASLNYFTTVVDDWGPAGYAAYMAVYTALEVLALPAIPLTMTAGVLFGALPGTAMVSLSATAAATISFLIARYFARDKVRRSPSTQYLLPEVLPSLKHGEKDCRPAGSRQGDGGGREERDSFQAAYNHGSDS
mmetsp:Transcript_35765/g.101222  ORF Transcript_35765/g.101222 Transcript_35765/m.101222 type:complete len:270 (+) Transcript_35765:228-1037(+)